jgi:hypothetical protein
MDPKIALSEAEQQKPSAGVDETLAAALDPSQKLIRTSSRF